MEKPSEKGLIEDCKSSIEVEKRQLVVVISVVAATVVGSLSYLSAKIMQTHVKVEPSFGRVQTITVC